METFKNSPSRQGSHSGDKSDSPWRWFRSCHAKDVISGRGGGLCRREGKRQGPWPPPSRQVLPPCLGGTLPRARQTGWSPRAPQSGGRGVRTLWALLTLCHPTLTPNPTAPLLRPLPPSCCSSWLSCHPGLLLSTCGARAPASLATGSTHKHLCSSWNGYDSLTPSPPPFRCPAPVIETLPQTEPPSPLCSKSLLLHLAV